jgi:pyridoxal phosphate enzyme (YggS family)
MGAVADNLDAVRARIDTACRTAGRDPAEVRLLVVSKTQPAELVTQAYQAGARLFGENKVQELADKAKRVADAPGIRWALIGHLQTNKARLAADTAAEFHALDTLKVAEALDRRLDAAGRSIDVYLQVNSSGEGSKHGLDPADVERFASSLHSYQSLRVRGLMTLAVFSHNTDAVAACFAVMRDLQRRLRNLDTAAGTYDELSMGMSGDFELAIAYGATTVRVGQAIFGPRARPTPSPRQYDV